VLDSRLYSLADELVPAATWATFATASDGVGDIAKCAEERETMQLEGPRSQTRRDTANGYRRRTEATRWQTADGVEHKNREADSLYQSHGSSELQPAIGLVLWHLWRSRLLWTSPILRRFTR